MLDIARAGARHGCHEALFTLGERPELRYPVARDWLDRHGHASTVDYVAAMARLVLDTTGLLPHANTGAMSADELATLRRVAPSQGMMIESLRADLDAHRARPRQDPGAPAGHSGGGRGASDPLHHGNPGGHRRGPGRPHRSA